MDKKEIHKYTIRIECLVPATITYQVEAETAEEALRKTETGNGSKIDLHHGRRKIRQTARCYRRGTSMLVYSKAYGRS